MKNVITTATTSEAAVTTTSQRKTRPKFVRQMSFDLADTDTETNLPADNSNSGTTTATSAGVTAVTASRNNLEGSSKGHNKQYPHTVSLQFYEKSCDEICLTNMCFAHTYV